MELHASALEVAFVLVMFATVMMQRFLFVRARRDVTIFEKELKSDGIAFDYRIWCEDALRVARGYRGRSIRHSFVQFSGLAIGVWALFLPDPASTGLVLYRAATTVFVLSLVALMIYEDWAQLFSRRKFRPAGLMEF